MSHLSRRDILQGAVAAAILPAPKAAAATASATALISHPSFFLHDPGPFNVERPARMTAIDGALRASFFAGLKRLEAPLRDDAKEAILRAHEKAYFDHIKALANDVQHLPYPLDADTVLSAHSWEAILRGVGAGLLAVDMIMDPNSATENAFCQIRPPGHHATQTRAMGFCFFSNIAIAALYARARHGAERIAVVDFDVHHGNGTQTIFWSNRDLMYGSTHEMPLFPGTGAVSETGVGNIFNAPLRAGDGGEVFRQAMKERILPAVAAHRPDLIMISSGFDAHAHDPLAHIRLHEPDFEWVTEQVMELAAKLCHGRIVSILEGGYNLDALASSTATHVKTLMSA